MAASRGYFFLEQSRHIPGPIRDVLVSLVRLEARAYVTGIEVTLEGHNGIQIGYQNPRYKEAIGLVGGGAVNGRLVGFNLVIGLYGVQGMQGIFTSGRVSDCIGRVEDVPRARIMAPGDIIHALKLGLDT